MRAKLVSSPSLLILVWSYQVTAALSIGYRMSDLLKPQLRLQLSLSIPEFYFDAFARNPSPALDQAVDVLLFEQVPFRLFLNKAKAKLEPLVSRSLRHNTENRVVWLVFVVVKSKSQGLDLHQVLRACNLGTARGLSSTVHKDLIQVVVDDSAAAEPWDGSCYQ